MEVGPARDDDEAGIKKEISRVAGVIGQIELRGEHRPIAPLNLYMKMRRSAWVLPRNQGLEHELAFAVGILMPTKTIALVVVLAPVIALPEIQKRPWNGTASGIDHLPGESHSRRFHAWLNEPGPLG